MQDDCSSVKQLLFCAAPESDFLGSGQFECNAESDFRKNRLYELD